MILFIQFVRRDRWKCTYSLFDVMIILAVFMTKNKWLKFFQAVCLWLNAVGAGSIDAFQTYHKLRLIFMHANHIHLIKIWKKNQPWLWFLFCVQPYCRLWRSLASYLFVCLFHGGVFRVPCMNFISCQSPVTSYQKSVKCRRLSHHIVLFISDALPLRTSTGDGFAGGLIWIIRRRRMRYLCSRCMEISGCDIAGDGIRRQLFAPLYCVYTHTHTHVHTHTQTHASDKHNQTV